MPNLLEHRFAIKRITKPSNEDYISALKIYNVFITIEQPKLIRNIRV